MKKLFQFVLDCSIYVGMRRRLFGWDGRLLIGFLLVGAAFALSWSVYLVLHNGFYSNPAFYWNVLFCFVFWTAFRIAENVAEGAPKLRNHKWPSVILVGVLFVGVIVLREIAFAETIAVAVMFLATGTIVGLIFMYMEYRAITKRLKNGKITEGQIFSTKDPYDD